MDHQASLPRKNFSAIARQLLLNRQPAKAPEPAELFEPKSETGEEVLSAQCGGSVYHPTFVPEDKLRCEPHLSVVYLKPKDVKPPSGEVSSSSKVGCCDEEFLRQINPNNPLGTSRPVIVDVRLCTLLRRLPVSRFATVNADKACRPVLSKSTKVMVRRVRQFFEEIKKILGDAAEGTIFTSTVELTAYACGVTCDIVTRLGKRPEFVHELLPRSVSAPLTKEQLMQNVLNRYGDQWGDIIRYTIENKLPKDNMTVKVLQAELKRSYVDFHISRTTLYMFLMALGVRFTRNRGRQNMYFEK